MGTTAGKHPDRPKSLLPQAVIDPYNSMWADREYELFALNNVMGSCFRLYENYKSKVELSRLCDLKCGILRPLQRGEVVSPARRRIASVYVDAGEAAETADEAVFPRMIRGSLG